MSEKSFKNIFYTSTSDPKQSLDLYQPLETTNAPVLVFIHGGGWNEGDKNLETDGRQLYEDIGRAFSAQNILTAVINYRLLPKVSWRDQLKDVAAAVTWVRDHASEYGGDSSKLFVSGHSAGAQLAARVALDPDLLGKKDGLIAGVIAVSGAGYEIEKRLSYYARRFQESEGEGWQKEVSLLRFVNADSPPFLIFYGSKEARYFREQANKLAETCRIQGAKAKLIEIPNLDHFGTVLSMSEPESPTMRSMLEFIR
jgi:acetyl esterase/lipase